MHLPRRPVGHLLGRRRPVGEVEDGVDRVRVVDVVGREARRVRRPGRLPVADVPAEVGRRHPQVEEPPFLPVLIADGAGKVRPLRRFGVLGRVERVEADVAEPARHADEVRRLDLARMLEVVVGVPVRLVELRIGESPQSDDAGRVAGNAGHGRLVALIHPQAVLVGRRRGAAARLRDRAERREAAAVEPRVHVRQQVDVAFGELRHLDPELLVAAGPEVPGVAAGALRVGQIPAAIAVVRLVGLVALRVGRRLRRPLTSPPTTTSRRAAMPLRRRDRCRGHAPGVSR